MYGWGTVTLADPACSTRFNWAIPSCWFARPSVATPNLPSGAHGEVVFPEPGAGGGMTLPVDPNDAQAVVDEIANQQLLDQQAVNRDAIAHGGSVWWDIEAAAANAGDAAAAAASLTWNWLPWALGGLGVFALVALSAGGPRRYGR